MKSRSQILSLSCGIALTCASVANAAENQYAIGAGGSLLTYSDPKTPSFSQSAVTAKFGVSRPLAFTEADRPFLDIGLSGYVTAFAIHSTAAATARFLGLNLRVGYTFPQISDPWKLTLNVGYYYATMFASNGRFGYKDVSGPELFPTLRRSFENQQSVLVYFKYSPITSGIQVLDLSNREIATGAVYSWPSSTPGHFWSATLDLADLQLRIGNFKGSSRSSTLGVGYSL